MGISVPEQLWTFLYSIAYGVALGVFYDLFRVLRLIFIPSSVSAFIQDVLFWIISGIVTFMYMFSFNDGMIRFYMLCGVFLGWILYYFTLGGWIYAFLKSHRHAQALDMQVFLVFVLANPLAYAKNSARLRKNTGKYKQIFKNAFTLFHFRRKHNKMNNVKYQYARIDARRRRKYEKKKPSMIFMLTILLVCVALVASIISVRINIDKKNQEISELNAKFRRKQIPTPR